MGRIKRLGLDHKANRRAKSRTERGKHGQEKKNKNKKNEGSKASDTENRRGSIRLPGDSTCSDPNIQHTDRLIVPRYLRGPWPESDDEGPMRGLGRENRRYDSLKGKRESEMESRRQRAPERETRLGGDRAVKQRPRTTENKKRRRRT